MYFGYCLEKATNRVLHYWSFPELPVDTELYDYVQCAEEDKPELYEPEVPLVYDGNTLIAWGRTQPYALTLIAHHAAFLDFANKANNASRDNFLGYATDYESYLVATSQPSQDLITIANAIIAQAITLGAPITGVE